MQVIATAGHVDHGKSALVRALTGMEPDRWAEERRRGLTIDLGFAWMDLPGGERLAFVDVPGHERFVPNMLAGVGPVPAVLLVVAADGGWMPQSAEHLAAIDAVGIRHGLLAITRCDLADPGPATRQARAQMSSTGLGAVEAVAVSAVTGAGLPELRAALARLVSLLPAPDADAPVRLWVDRSFTIRGSGTVVTGTLPAGTVRTGQELMLTPSMRPARVRGIESLNEPASSVSGVARVALNLRGLAADVPARGMALVDPGRWTMTRLADVRLSVPRQLRLPAQMTLHIGSARTLARVRPLGSARAALPGSGDLRPADRAAVGMDTLDSAGADPARADPDGSDRVTAIARLTLRDPLPLHVGDRILLRDPGSAGLAILGATVLDVAPPPLSGRGAAAGAGRELAAWPEVPSPADLLRRHGLLRASALAAMGCAGPGGTTPRDPPAHGGPARPPMTPGPPGAGEWLVDPGRWADLRRKLADAVAAHARRDPLAIGMTPEAARAALGLPDRSLIEALARQPTVPGEHPQIQLSGGYLRLAAGDDQADATVAAPTEAPAQRRQSSQESQRHSASPEPRESRPSREPLPSLPTHVLAGVRAVLADLAREPFMAPEAGRLRELGLDPKAIAAAARAGMLLRVTEQIVLAPGAEAQAAQLLAKLAQPFTAAEARRVLGTTRRVAIPLLEHLDRAGITQRLPDDRRRLRLVSRRSSGPVAAVRPLSGRVDDGRPAGGEPKPPAPADGLPDPHGRGDGRQGQVDQGDYQQRERGLSGRPPDGQGGGHSHDRRRDYCAQHQLGGSHPRRERQVSGRGGRCGGPQPDRDRCGQPGHQEADQVGQRDVQLSRRDRTRGEGQPGQPGQPGHPAAGHHGCSRRPPDPAPDHWPASRPQEPDQRRKSRQSGGRDRRTGQGDGRQQRSQGHRLPSSRRRRRCGERSGDRGAD
ncbi:MAG TPA: selenocysteine-specific translation elongation factor [Streptosporangiaceae bacterium]|nr:selenocysteine-specific translation elongation factor [Streptosporangiaceae bacterium]